MDEKTLEEIKALIKLWQTEATATNNEQAKDRLTWCADDLARLVDAAKYEPYALIEEMHERYEGQWAEPASKAILTVGEALLHVLIDIRNELRGPKYVKVV